MGRGRASQRGRLSEGRQDVKNLIRQFRAASGYVTAATIPDRGTNDIYGNLFSGLPGSKLAAQTITTAEIAPQSVTDIKIADFAILNSKLAPDSVGSVKIIDGAVNTNKIEAGAITTSRIAELAVTTARLDSGSVTESKCDASLKNPGQSVTGLRSIGGNGQNLTAAASDHSHGSGNSMDFDYLPATVQERTFLARTRVRQGVSQIPTMTVDQLKAYLKELAIVASMALTLQIDAPDLRADERKAMRDRGEPYGEFFEHRRRHVLDARGPLHERDLRHYQSPPAEIAEIVV